MSIGRSVLEKKEIVKCVLTAIVLGLCRYLTYVFNFLVCFLHHFIISLWCLFEDRDEKLG